MAQKVLASVEIQNPDYTMHVRIRLVAMESGLELIGESKTPGLLETMGLPKRIDWSTVHEAQREATSR
jgi:hypothetical protein